MLWQPGLITDERGRARLPLDFADSITTWRLSTSASSRGGLLGGMTTPLKVFQDFFVDIDLPVTLTQNDEVAFPVAVYNYLKTPQTVKIELQQEPWFELLEGRQRPHAGLEAQRGDRRQVPHQGQEDRPAAAHSSRPSAPRCPTPSSRSIEVVPDGQKIEQVVTDRLTGKVKQTLDHPGGLRCRTPRR